MIEHKRRWGLLLGVCAFVAVLLLQAANANAQESREFSLQVNPSPLVVTAVPGQTKQLELSIRNNGSIREDLKFDARSFRYDSNSQKVELNDDVPQEVKDWVQFASQKFSIERGAWSTQKITLKVPQSAGFSYSFAIVISRQNEPTQQGGRTLQASVAVFTLINIDRPGARKVIELATFSSPKKVYEYLPATFNITLRNSGNTIVQPYGNIYVQRGQNDDAPLGVLPVNDVRGYILPNTNRTFSATWQDGFPVYTDVKVADNAQSKRVLIWNWEKLTSLRVGRYTAKLIAVYNDGTRDIPIQTSVTFWVFPWKIILGLIGVGLLVVLGVYTAVRSSVRVIRHRKKRGHEHRH